MTAILITILATALAVEFFRFASALAAGRRQKWREIALERRRREEARISRYYEEQGLESMNAS